MNRFDPKKYTQILDNNIEQFLLSSKGSRFRSGNPFNTMPTLLIVQVGNNPAAQKYVSLKKAFCEKFGLSVKLLSLNTHINDDQILDQIQSVFLDPSVHGGIIQLPLPRPSLKSTLDLIPIEKDCDLLSFKSAANFYSADFSRLSPVIRAFNTFFIDSHGAIITSDGVIDNTSTLTYISKHLPKMTFTVVGNGSLVGKPLAYYLTKLGGTVSVVDNYKKGDKINSDYVILATDVAYLVSGEDINSHACVVDFGSSVVNGTTVGNLDTNTSLDHLNLVAFSPGGMGPLVVRFLVYNFLGI